MKKTDDFQKATETFFDMMLIAEGNGNQRVFWIVSGSEEKIFSISTEIDIITYEHFFYKTVREKIGIIINEISRIPDNYLRLETFANCLLALEVAEFEDKPFFRFSLKRNEFSDFIKLLNKAERSSPDDYKVFKNETIVILRKCYRIFIKILERNEKSAILRMQFKPVAKSKNQINNPFRWDNSVSTGILYKFCNFLIKHIKAIKGEVEQLKKMFSGETMDDSVIFDWIYKNKIECASLFRRLQSGKYAIQIVSKRGENEISWKFLKKHLTVHGDTFPDYMQRIISLELSEDLETALDIIKLPSR